jgi:hypothetical protein
VPRRSRPADVVTLDEWRLTVRVRPFGHAELARAEFLFSFLKRAFCNSRLSRAIPLLHVAIKRLKQRKEHAMTNYTAHFYTEADWAETTIKAATPELALQRPDRLRPKGKLYQLRRGP